MKVGPQVYAARRRPPTAVDVASVSSAPLGEIVERTLEVSDNQAAEVLARHVGLAEQQEGSFAAGAASVLEVLRRLGVPTAGDRLYDGSGLSRQNVLTTDTLAGVRPALASERGPSRAAAGPHRPARGRASPARCRTASTRGPTEARGRVRAKTGTLTGVHGLAGVADDAERCPDGLRGGGRPGAAC